MPSLWVSMGRGSCVLAEHLFSISEVSPSRSCFCGLNSLPCWLNIFTVLSRPYPQQAGYSVSSMKLSHHNRASTGDICGQPMTSYLFCISPAIFMLCPPLHCWSVCVFLLYIFNRSIVRMLIFLELMSYVCIVCIWSSH